MGKQAHTKHDQYSKLAVIRVAKDEEGKILRLKKYIYLSSVASYEEGDSSNLNVEEPTIYIVSEYECFYIIGDINEFNKVMNDYVADIRKLSNLGTNPSE